MTQFLKYNSPKCVLSAKSESVCKAIGYIAVIKLKQKIH